MAEPRVDGLAVVLLLCNDTDRAACFYRDVLGLELLAEEHGGRQRHYGCRLGSLYLTIQARSDFPGTQSASDHDPIQLCFTVSDLPTFLAHAQTLGVEPLHPPRAF